MGKILIAVIIILLVVAGVAVMKMKKGGDISDTPTGEDTKAGAEMAEINELMDAASSSASSAKTTEDVSATWEEEAPTA